MIQLRLLPQLKDNYAFIIRDEENEKTLVIDPAEGEGVEKLLRENDWRLDLIINTHHHRDHVGGNEYLKSKFNCEIASSSVDKDRIAGASRVLTPGEKYSLGDLDFEVHHIPGHTHGHMAVRFPKQKWLFCGDTMFSLGCGRLFEGTHEQLFASLQLLCELGVEHQIFCGHEYTARNWQFAIELEPSNQDLQELKAWIDSQIQAGRPTLPTHLKRERECNPFLRLRSSEIHSHLKLDDPTDIEVFRALRELRNQF